MNERMFKDDLLEAVFRQAVTARFDRELDEIANDLAVEFSEWHEQRMKKLFRTHRHRETRQHLWLWTKRIAACFAAFIILFGAVLLISPDVRAAVSKTITQWLETNMRFSGHEDTPVSRSNAGFPQTKVKQSKAKRAIF